MNESRNKPCTVEIAIRGGHCEEKWTNVGRFRSIRHARANLTSAIYSVVDRLSRRYYEIWLVLADGSIRPLKDKEQDHAVEQAKAWQYHNSIGARLRRGEAVAV